MNLKQNLENLLTTLDNKPYTKQSVLREFKKRVQKNSLIKWENITDHICSFFIPVHLPSQSLYLVHHKKASDWIPPGGHIDRGELPFDTIKREFNEELSFRLSNEPINFFNISIKHIENNPRNTCKLHYDLWFTVAMKDKHNFTYLEKEFHDAKWIDINKALGKSVFPHINDMYQKMKDFVFIS
jgi:8-oxo-dGTP pyrophosphatase MutT (NUDIX family)